MENICPYILDKINSWVENYNQDHSFKIKQVYFSDYFLDLCNVFVLITDSQFNIKLEDTVTE